MANITIAIDAMGGDHGPSVSVPAACELLSRLQDPSLKLILVGDEALLTPMVQLLGKDHRDQLTVHHASEVVGMDEPPAQALRFKKDSSMRVAINLVKNGTAEACVSAGNTGALMATARFILRTWPGIDRPAISALLPTMKPGKVVRMLDLGANVDSTPEHLFQFAVMGSVLSSAVGNIPNPKVGLLNIGSEEIKGNEQVKEAARLLSETRLVNYAGFVEGDDIYKGNVDVIACDGFVGNIALKSSEGVAKMVRESVRAALNENFYTKLVAFFVKPILVQVAKRFDPARYNGASLVGLQGTVVKSHGSADKKAFSHAIHQAVLEVQNNVAYRIGDEIARLMKELEGA